MTKYSTLPSLAFGLFRTHFLVSPEEIKKAQNKELLSQDKTKSKTSPILPERKLYKEVAIHSKIHMLSGIIEQNIREGYTGGAVDMYIPSLENSPLDTKIYAYDVNSLYPFVMANNRFPIGNPTYFEGDII
jgi:hypothetical protein